MVAKLEQFDYRDIFEDAVEGMFLTTPDGHFIQVNPALVRMLGYASPDELIRERTDLSRQHFVDPRRYEEYQRLIMAHGFVRGFEYEAYRKNGSTIWLSDSVRSRKNKTGELLYYEGISRDVTRSKLEARELIRLLAQEQAVRHETEIFRDADFALTQDLTLDIVLETLLDCLRKLVPYDSANVMLCEPDATFIIKALRRYERFQDAKITRAISLDGNTNILLKRLYTTKQSVLVPDTQLEPGWQWMRGAEHVRNWLGVPLVASGKVIGLYSVDKVQPDFFKPEHARLAESLAARAASAIHNAQLFQQSKDFSRRLIEAQEEERQRIARELHDQIGQILTAVRINLHAIQDVRDTREVLSYIQDNISVIDDALRQVRDLSTDLRPPMLDDIGLGTALRWYVEKQTKRTGTKADIIIVLPDHNERFSPELETACFRIAQEAITNVIRHAQAKRVSVILRKGTWKLILTIRDDGIGFDVVALRTMAPRGATLGLLGMQERAQAIGGTIEINSIPSKGTEIHAIFPIKARR